MNANIPEGIIDWLSQIGVEGHLNPQQIENGRFIGHVMHSIVDGYNLQLLSSTSAVNRVSNWNNLIAELKKIGIKVSQQDKAKIINGNHEIVFYLVGRLRDYHQRNQKQTEVDISKISVRSDVNQSHSLLELFILLIMKNFNLSSKQSVALLSNEGKYLAHILAKGLKGDFKPIEGLISELLKCMNQINDFCKNRDNEIFFVRSVKPALISKSQIISESALGLFTEFMANSNNKFDIMKEHLLNTLLLAIKRHSYLSQSIVKFLLRMSDYNKTLLMILKPQTTDSEFQNIFIDMWEISKEENKLNELYQMKGVRELISNSILNIKGSDTVLSSLNLLISLCNEDSNVLSNDQYIDSFVENIQKVSLSNHGDAVCFTNQLFSLLSIFGKDKNGIAPTLYKLLTTKYQQAINVDEAQLFIINFLEIVREFPTIPFNIIVQVINSKVEANTLKISEAELQFFEYIIESEFLDLKTALIVYNIVSKVIVDETAFARSATYIIVNLLKKFSTESIFMDMTIKLVKVLLAIHFANAKKIVLKKKSLSTSKGQSDEITLKSKNLSVDHFLYKVAELQFTDINTQIQPLICYSTIQIQRSSKELTKGLRKVLGIIGNVDKLLKKYEDEVHKMDEEGNKKEDGKKSKIKDASWGSPANSRYHRSPEDRVSSHIGPDDFRKKSASKGENSSYLTFLGVTPVAQKGLQKYHKVYLQKVEKVEQQKNKVVEAHERQSYLKKMFERKMLEKGVEVKKVNSQDFKYIFEFDQKQKELEEDKVRGKIDILWYDGENEEERDIKALQYSMKKYQRVMKVYYSQYSGHHKPKKLDNFAEIAEHYHLLTSSSLMKLLRDHSLDDYITVRQCQYICKKINIRLKKEFQDFTYLDYEGFEQFILQVSFAMFTRPPKDFRGKPISEMVEETMSHFKRYSTENRINEKLFEDPDNIYFNETVAIDELNKKLAENNQYILPEGYKKVIEKKVLFTHKIFLDAMSPVYKDVYQILNQILYGAFNFNVIEPFTTYETIAKARPALYYTQRLQGEYFSEKMSIFMKRQVAKYPIKDRETAKQAAGILDDIIDAVELGHDKIGIRHQNPVVKQKRLREQEARKISEEGKKKRAEREKYIKSALTKHKQVVTEKKKQEKVKRKEEKQKLKEEEEKRKKEEEALKKKVEEYQKQKKEEEKKRRLQSRERRRKQKEQIEKKVQELEEHKKKKQEEKKEKEEEQRKKKREEAAEQRRRREEQKRIFDEEQKKKKQLIEEYKSKKSQLKNSKVIDSG